MEILLGLGVLFLIVAVVAYVLGARGLAGFTASVGKWLLIVFAILAVIFLVFGGIGYFNR